MKKILLLAVACLFVSVACFAETQDFAKDYFLKIPYKSVIFTQKSTSYSDGSDTPLVVTGRSYIKNGKVRSELLDEKGNPVTLTIAKDGYSYTQLDIKSKEGFKAATDIKNPAFALLIDSEGRKNAVKKGEENVNGVKCGVFEYTEIMKVLMFETKMKITEYRNIDGFAMKTVSFTEGKDPSRASVTEIIKLEKNAAISDSKFDIPKGVVYTDMTDLAGTIMGKGGPKTSDKANEASVITSGDNPEKAPELEQPAESENSGNNNENAAAKIAGEAAGAVLKGLFGQ